MKVGTLNSIGICWIDVFVLSAQLESLTYLKLSALIIRELWPQIRSELGQQGL